MNPLDIPILLSGSFGELRSNHFHAGLDIKTLGKEGLHVFAAANGYVSRIKVQQFGTELLRSHRGNEELLRATETSLCK